MSWPSSSCLISVIAGDRSAPAGAEPVGVRNAARHGALRPLPCFLPGSSTRTGRSERVHRRSSRALRGEPICQTLGVSACEYHQRASGQRSERQLEDERLIALIPRCTRPTTSATARSASGGSRGRQGEDVGRDRVARLMRHEGIRGAQRRRQPWRTTHADPAARKRPDLVKRQAHREPAQRAVALDAARSLRSPLIGRGVMQGTLPRLHDSLNGLRGSYVSATPLWPSALRYQFKARHSDSHT